VNLIEPLARLIETATLAYSHKQVVQGRTGNRLDASAPRNAYPTADGRWVALSSASLNIVKRLYRTVERPDLAENPDYVDPVRRQGHADEIDDIVAGWVAARPFAEVMDKFEQAEVAAAPVYDAAQLLADEHLAARGTFVQVADPDLGPMTVQAPVVRFRGMTGRIDFLGRAVGADNDAVYGELLGLDPERLAELRAAGTI
jgi:crotonobetainyl-CoA:carnitine CoA-transferase CaiB-like acyl-CoA transferase